MQTLWCDTENADYVRERLNVPGCRLLIRVDRDVFRADLSLASTDTRYFVSSLDTEQTSPSELLCLIRNHWQVENSLHWVKDRYWEEDKHYLKRAGHIFVELTNMAVSILRSVQKKKQSLKEIAEDFHFDPKKLLQSLGFA